MGKDLIISFTTIVTLLIIVFSETAHTILRSFHFPEPNILIGSLVAALLFFVLAHTVLPRRYLQIGRLTVVLCLALAVESFANFIIIEIGKWPSLLITVVAIYGLAWYGFVETHKLKAL